MGLESENWTEVITPKRGVLDINLKELWNHKYLTYLFVKRDVVAGYKQTVLGPLWYVVQPIFTTIIFTFVFSNIARISTDGLPAVVFYMLGTIFWGFFSTCLNKTAGTFVANASIFGKVYFPRLTVPISTVISSLLFFLIQLGLFFFVWFYYLVTQPGIIQPNLAILWTPFILLLMATLGLGLGIIISSITTKYRDFNFLLGFGVQLWMYASPIIYPSSEVTKRMPSGSLTLLVNQLNPITYMMEILRYGFLGKGLYSLHGLAYSTIITLVILIIGVIIFNRVEKSFMDTV